MPAGKLKHTSQDFCDWADTYFMTNLNNRACSSMDLYSARCGLLHTMTYESDLTIKQAAKSIFYAWGDHKESDLQQLIRQIGRNDIALHVDGMIAALSKGLQDFLQAIQDDPKKLANALGKASKMFTAIKMMKK